MSTRTPAHTGGDESTDPALSVFCDESWYTAYGATHMTVGAMICPLPDVQPCAEAVRALKTAYCTERRGRIEQLRRERDAAER